MSETKKIFKARLRDCRIDAMLTQSQLAHKSGLQPAAISHYERGERTPCITNLARLADALGINAGYLVGSKLKWAKFH
jgi:transcriptional regulator with XRE-family HTH domain